jgi:hypothetical protein
MNDSNPLSSPAERPRAPRNKGKLTGPKPPLRPGHVWSIRAKLQLERRTRDLALFNLAIDSKLRGGDLVALRVDDVAPNGCENCDKRPARPSWRPPAAPRPSAGLRSARTSRRKQPGSPEIAPLRWPEAASFIRLAANSR